MKNPFDEEMGPPYWKEMVLKNLGIPPQFLTGDLALTYSSANLALRHEVKRLRTWKDALRGNLHKRQRVLKGCMPRYRTFPSLDEKKQRLSGIRVGTPRREASTIHAGNYARCGACPHSLACVQQKMLRICRHCRSVSVLASDIVHGSAWEHEKDWDTASPKTKWRWDGQVPATCPLFLVTQTLCPSCHDRKVFRTRQTLRLHFGGAWLRLQWRSQQRRYRLFSFSPKTKERSCAPPTIKRVRRCARCVAPKWKRLA